MISTGSAVHVLVGSTKNQQAVHPGRGVGRALRLKAGLAVFGLVSGLFGGLLVGSPAVAKGPEPGSAMAVSLSSLPAEAKRTHQLIMSGGPFPYEKDGTVFGNRERLLPSKARGYYREYTVKTPGSRDRGARRIVCGGKPPTQPESCFYTADHYASFRRISP